MSVSIFDDIRPNSFYQEMTEPEDDGREPLTADEQWEIFKTVEELNKPNNNG